MPNQLAQSKRRHSLAEHEAVLAALAVIAQREGTTVAALLRTAAREMVKQRATLPKHAKIVSATIWAKAPRMPVRFKTAAQVARFKRAQREFDQVVLDVQLASPQQVQRSNSIAASSSIRLVDFDRAHVAK